MAVEYVRIHNVLPAIVQVIFHFLTIHVVLIVHCHTQSYLEAQISAISIAIAANLFFGIKVVSLIVQLIMNN